MTIRRVKIENLRIEGAKVVADLTGVDGESYVAEVWSPYGFASNPGPARSASLNVNGSYNNVLSLPPGGYRLAADQTTVVYYGDTSITVSAGGVHIEGSGKITTDMTIETTGDVIASGISLREHVHGGVAPGASTTSVPQ